MWRSLSHKFVLPFLGIYEHKSVNQFFLVYEEWHSGPMAERSKNPSVAEIEEHVWTSVLLLFVDSHPVRKVLEVAKGIQYIHSEGVVHGDLRGVSKYETQYVEILTVFCRLMFS